MSIQDWSETDSSKPDSPDSSFLEIDSFEKDTFEIENSEINSTDMDIFENSSLEKTYALYEKGLDIGEIAEIEGLSIKNVYRQFEKLVLSGKVRKIERLVPSERQEQVKSLMEELEIEIDALIRAKTGEGCQEEELNLIRALLMSKILYPI